MKIGNIVYIFLQINFAFGENVLFHLYNRQHRQTFLDVTDYWNYTDSASKYKFIIHGFLSNGEEEWIKDMKEEYLNKDEYNIIAVDWSALSGQFAIDSLPLVIDNELDPVANLVAGYILGLEATGVKLKDIHVIGHSLGAHVAGFAGKLIATTNQNKKVGRITGLDPAGPGFKFINQNILLNAGDADFVDVIHTSKIGLARRSGHSDFYVNGGNKQPGCWLDIILDLFWKRKIDCSHSRAYLYFTESINSNKFVATQCNSYADYKKKRCKSNCTTSMGENVNQQVQGKLYLQTNGSPPYAKNGAISRWFN